MNEKKPLGYPSGLSLGGNVQESRKEVQRPVFAAVQYVPAELLWCKAKDGARTAETRQNA
jgi:hypothetical protein